MRTALLLGVALAALVSLAHGQAGGSFAKVEFSGDINVEVPRNWSYLDANLRRHLSTGSEAMARLSGAPANSEENIILVAGNAFTSFKTPSATLRLSVRADNGASQADMREAAKASKTELAPIVKEVAESTRKAMMGGDGYRSATFVRGEVVSNKSLICFLIEFETDAGDGLKRTQTYICPMGTRNVKLTTSYRKSEAVLFWPVVQYVWQSLAAR